MIRFHAGLHEYRDGGTVIPSVSQVLKQAGLAWYPGGAGREAMELGTAVHRLCARYAGGQRADDRGREIASLEYAGAFADFCTDEKAVPVAAEKIISHAIDGYRYAGTFDLLADINGEKTLIDIKTGSPAPWHAMQLAAYALASDPDRVMCLYLTPGSYRRRYFTAEELLQASADFGKALAAWYAGRGQPAEQPGSWFGGEDA
jgi:hypothetical protein